MIDHVMRDHGKTHMRKLMAEYLARRPFLRCRVATVREAVWNFEQQRFARYGVLEDLVREATIAGSASREVSELGAAWAEREGLKRWSDPTAFARDLLGLAGSEQS